MSQLTASESAGDTGFQEGPGCESCDVKLPEASHLLQPLHWFVCQLYSLLLCKLASAGIS